MPYGHCPPMYNILWHILNLCKSISWRQVKTVQWKTRGITEKSVTVHSLCVWKIRGSILGTDISCLFHFLHENRGTGHISSLYYFQSVYHVRTLIRGRSSLQDLSLSTVQLGKYSYTLWSHRPLPGIRSHISSYHSLSVYNTWSNSTLSLPYFLSLNSSTHSL